MTPISKTVARTTEAEKIVADWIAKQDPFFVGGLYESEKQQLVDAIAAALRQQSELVEGLKRALEPFAAMYSGVERPRMVRRCYDNDDPIYQMDDDPNVVRVATVGDLRRAAAALSSTGEVAP